MAEPPVLTVDGAPLAFEPGDTVALALLRGGIHPGRGGTICLAGDCPNCLCVVDGVSYVRACQVPARDGAVVERQGARGVAPVPEPGPGAPVRLGHVHCDVAVVGRGPSGLEAAAEARAAGRTVVELDARDGQEVVGIYDGPRLVVRLADGMLHVHAGEVVIATGAAEEQPVWPGSELEGFYTARAAAELERAGLLPDSVATIGPDTDVVRIEGDTRVRAIVVRAGDAEHRAAFDGVVVDRGLHPRDGLARQGAGLAVRVVGDAAVAGRLPPPPPPDAVVCRCTGTTVADLDSVWDRGFREMELVKRATLAGTGTCQGGACLPHLRAYLAARTGETPAPFTARPMTRQLTMEEAAGGVFFPPVRRTALDGEHRGLGARMERFGGWWRPWTYGDTAGEYAAVREGVSIGDVSTLGKVLVSGPDAVRFLERIYPCRVGDLVPGRIRYALLLDERGYVFDDGVIVRDSERRFTLTFTTGGAAGAEAWLRDWAEGFQCNVRIVDRTVAVAAINVTGPRAADLLARCGLTEPPAFMRAAAGVVAGVPCDVMRLGFTGEPSWELHHPADRSAELWQALLEAGADLGVRPHGLQALLALRLEKGHVIVGMDTDFDSTPRRLGMEWAVRSDGVRDFVGGDALTRIDAFPLDRRLVALEMDGPAPVDGSPIFAGAALRGNVTSAWFSASLGHSVLLAFADLVDGALPAAFQVDGRPARVVELPFYDREGLRVRA